MEKLADAGIQAPAVEDFHSMAELLRQTGIFGLFMKEVLRQGLWQEQLDPMRPLLEFSPS